MITLLTIYLMAITPVSLRPPSISSLVTSTPATISAPAASTTTTKSSAQVFADNLAARRAANAGSNLILGQVNQLGSDLSAVSSGNPNSVLSSTLSGATGASTVGQLNAGIKSGAISTPTIQSAIDTGKKPTLNLSSNQRVQVGNVASQFSNALSYAKGDRSSYNASLNYDGMNESRKRVADNFFDRNNKVKGNKEEEENLDPYKGLTDRQKELKIENDKQQALLEQQRKDAAEEALKNQQETQRNIDEQSGLISGERDRTIAEQESMAQSAESNRLNQLRGNIMSRLAQRGVDIFRLSPEQITALSGEEGSRAFMDVADIKDRKTKTIESVRQSALAKLSELRDKKSINQTTYNSRVNEIDSKTAAAKLQAEKEFGANVFSLVQTKDQQSRSDALARVNAAQTYLSANDVSGPTAAAAIAAVEKQTGYGPEQVFQIAKSPQFIEKLKAIEAANIAQKNIDNALKQGKLTIDEYKAQTARIAANRPRSANAGSVTIDFQQAGI